MLSKTQTVCQSWPSGNSPESAQQHGDPVSMVVHLATPKVACHAGGRGFESVGPPMWPNRALRRGILVVVSVQDVRGGLSGQKMVAFRLPALRGVKRRCESSRPTEGEDPRPIPQFLIPQICRDLRPKLLCRLRG